MRRIKSVALSIPSVVGPYTSVNCTLSLLRSSLRISPIAGAQYDRDGSGDIRFTDYGGAIQSVVTSGANNDSGMFETNLRDERFLPFEGAGAISTWKLDLPKDFASFDYSTISDVVLHIRYTARQGVEPTAVTTALATRFQPPTPPAQSTLALMFSLRNDFPTEWAAFVNGTSAFSAEIRSEYFPYMAQGKTITITGLDIYGDDVSKHKTADSPSTASPFTMSGPFTVSAAADTGVNAVLPRSADAQAYLIVRYALS
jgi:hypothetical protein